MTAEHLLSRLVAALNAANIPYMLTGSYASSLHSIPRATRDIDIVIFPNRDQLTQFVQSLPASSYHTDLEEAIDSLRRRGQFNVIDYATGWKVDFIIPPFEDSTSRNSSDARSSKSATFSSPSYHPKTSWLRNFSGQKPGNPSVNSKMPLRWYGSRPKPSIDVMSRDGCGALSSSKNGLPFAQERRSDS